MPAKPHEFVNIEVDGKPLSVRKDQYLLWSLRDNYLSVPHFCAHKWLDPPFGGCRMCMVQIETGGKMWPKLQTSCSTLPSEGMKVYTQSSPVLQNRKEQLEFHLINHPLECPVCDKGGECMLQDQTMEHGMAEGRFIEEKRTRPDAIINEYMQMNYKRCFQCKRCIHYNEMIDGTHMMKFVRRGASTRIESFPPPGEAPRFSGNLIDICPVGAITARNYRFMGRPWEQELAQSIGSLDSVGANVWNCARLGELTRIIPRDNDEVDFGYLDDATRFSWECTDSGRYLEGAIIRREGNAEPVSAGRGEREAGKILASILGEHGPDSVGLIAGPGLNCEDYLALRRFSTDVLKTKYFHFGEDLFGPAGLDKGVLRSFASQGSSINGIVNASTVLTIGCDLFEEAPVLGLRLDIAAHRHKLNLLSMRSHGSDIDRHASATLEYGYGNLLRFVLALTNGVSGKGECPEEFQALASRLKSCGDDAVILFGSEVWRSANPAALVRALMGLRQAIAEANPQAKVYLNPVYPQVNSLGALLLNYPAEFGSSMESKQAAAGLGKVLEAAAKGSLKALVMVDQDILSTYPDQKLVARALGAVTSVIYVGPYSHPTSEHAAVHLPLGSFAHRSGLVVSLEWRVQKRSAANISPAPAVIEIVNGLCTQLDAQPVALDNDELHSSLAEAYPGWPQGNLRYFEPKGHIVSFTNAGEEPGSLPATDLPAEVKGNAEHPLVVVPKRFMYNDRPELRNSEVFERIALPFYAFMNPTDMKVLNLSNGDHVELDGGGAKSSLPIKAAAWVRAGSVVINDYFLGAPANAIAGFEPVRVAVKRASKAVEAGA